MSEILDLDCWEIAAWAKYFERFPHGIEDDQRTHMILQALGCKEPAERLFYSIKTMKEHKDNQSLRKHKTIENSPFGSRLKQLYDEKGQLK